MPAAVTKLRARSSAAGIIGCEARRSQRAKPASTSVPTTSGAATGHEPHGCAADSIRPSVTATRPTALLTTPTTSSRRHSGFRVSATATIAPTIPTTANGTFTQNTDAHPK